MNQADDFLERIKLTETQNLDKLTRFFTGMRIVTTKNYAGSKKVKEKIIERTFKPDPFFKYPVLIFALVIFGFAIKETFFKGTTNSAGLVFAYCFSGILLYLIIKQFYFDKSLNYTICVNQISISIDDQVFFWKDICETAILIKNGGNSDTKYLVIVLNDQTTYVKFELTHFINLNFWGFSSSLSKYIEYFKSNACQ